MTTHRAAVLLYSTRIPIDGWGGLPLLGMAAALAAVLPAAALLLLGGLAGGAVIASALVALRG